LDVAIFTPDHAIGSTVTVDRQRLEMWDPTFCGIDEVHIWTSEHPLGHPFSIEVFQDCPHSQIL
jgi:hypothetical protein